MLRLTTIMRVQKMPPTPDIAPTATLLLRGVSSVKATRLFAPFGPSCVKSAATATYLQFDSREAATLALQTGRLWHPDMSIEYCPTPPIDFTLFSPTGLSQDDYIQWCRNAGVNAVIQGDTIQLILGDPSSGSTVPDTLFPLAPSTGSCYDEFYKMLRDAMRQEGSVYTLPVAAITYAMVADTNTWAPFFNIEDNTQREHCIARQLELVFGIRHDFCAQLIARNNLEGALLPLIALLKRALKAWEEWGCPLRNLLQDPGFLKAHTKLTVIAKDDYTTEWGARLPPYWVSEDDRLLKRASRPVFENLVVTGTLENLFKCDISQRIVLIDGESGSGKTCALFAAACGTNEKYDLHFVTTASRLFPDIICGDVVARVRSYVHRVLRGLLERSQDNTDQPLRVLLYLDEVGANMVEGQYTVSGVNEYMRELIKKFSTLKEATIVGTGRNAVSISITVVAAGTGLEDMYGGEGGSIAGQYTTLRVKPPRKEALRNIISKYITRSTLVDGLLRCEEMSVLCTNARFLTYTLQELQRLINADALEFHVKKKYIKDELRQRAKRSPDSLGVTAETMSTLVRRLLPEACAAAARIFMGANGLSKLEPMERQVLLQVAHVALLKRTVLVSGKDTQRLALVDDGLRRAGFTPMRRPMDLREYNTDITMLVTASAAGLYTTTKVAGKLSPDHVAAGCEWTIGGETHCVMVPSKNPPIAMSDVYRVLPRLVDRSFFSATSPDDFEEVSTMVICEALRALAMQDGGCDYPTLLAAVLGADYEPLFEQNTATATRRITFHHVVRVRLNFMLGTGSDTSTRVLEKCAAALETHLSDWLETCGGMNGAELVRKRLEDLRAADPEKKREHMQRVMFVVTPGPRSPSPDLVLMCIGNKNDKEGYLGVGQFKQNTTVDPSEDTMEEECMKNGDTRVQTTKDNKNDKMKSGNKHSSDSKEVEKIEIQKRGDALRKELESCSGTALSDQFFIFWQKPAVTYFSGSTGTVPVHIHAPRTPYGNKKDSDKKIV